MNKVTFILIVIICTAPIIVANALFYFAPHIFTGSSGSEHGELLPQALPLADFEAQTFAADGWESFDLAALRGHWRLIAIVDLADCDTACESELVQLRQLRLALGEDLRRLRNVVVSTRKPSLEQLRKYREALPRFTVLTGATSLSDQLRGAFSSTAVLGDVYLVDPLGNVVMRYPSGSGPEGKVDDLRRLFKYSQL